MCPPSFEQALQEEEGRTLSAHGGVLGGREEVARAKASPGGPAPALQATAYQSSCRPSCCPGNGSSTGALLSPSFEPPVRKYARD